MCRVRGAKSDSRIGGEVEEQACRVLLGHQGSAQQEPDCGREAALLDDDVMVVCTKSKLKAGQLFYFFQAAAASQHK